MIAVEVKLLQQVGVSGCPVDNGRTAQVIFLVDLGILENQDPLPFHFYGELYEWIDAVQVFSEALSVVTVQLSV